MRSFFVLLFVAFAQVACAQVVSGLYSGTLLNDSTQKEQRYELALSEYRGGITGYSYTTFVRNDSLFYGVKRVRASRSGQQLIIEDDDMIINNFPESPARGVHQTNFISLTNEDTLHEANGTWQTNRTKKYYALSGSVALQLTTDSAHSALIGQLKELNILSSSKYQSLAHAGVKPNTKTAIKKTGTNTSNKTSSGRITETVSALPYTERKKIYLQPIEVLSDSLILSFYDNGMVDGDSISVFVNGENFISARKLTASATKKTIQLAKTEVTEVLLVAENLGSIPPNTGLLVIRDGEQTYQVNFSADMQNNAAILFKRRMK